MYSRQLQTNHLRTLRIGVIAVTILLLATLTSWNIQDSPSEGLKLNKVKTTFQKDVVIMARTFAGDRWRASSMLLPKVKMFVDLSRFDFMLVLDSESNDDHKYAACLHNHLPGMLFRFQEQPSNWENIFHAPFHIVGSWYGRTGYDRQQWSTFFLDEVAEPNHKAIAVIDADGCIFSHLTRENIFADDGRIILRAAKRKSAYPGDTLALMLPTPYDFMFIDRMPITFWKSTFPKVRTHISTIWNTTFNEAFGKFSNKKGYSQFNIIAHFALEFEPDHYKLVHHEADQGVVSIGGNRCRDKDTARGCCGSFGTLCTVDDEEGQRVAVNRFNYCQVSWLHNQTLVDIHYSNLQRDLQILNQTDSLRYDSMRQACEEYGNDADPNWCVSGIWKEKAVST